MRFHARVVVSLTCLAATVPASAFVPSGGLSARPLAGTGSNLAVTSSPAEAETFQRSLLEARLGLEGGDSRVVEKTLDDKGTAAESELSAAAEAFQRALLADRLGREAARKAEGAAAAAVDAAAKAAEDARQAELDRIEAEQAAQEAKQEEVDRIAAEKLAEEAVRAAAADPKPAMMDERIFKFNKFVIDTVYELICFFYPVKGTDRDFARFYVLETVARVPYFAYLSVMHLRETFGERDLGERMRTHYAEADNELHHLLIMESLGGNSNVVDRTLAQTMAFFYYWYVIVVYAISQQAAYHLSELIEDHAYDTYNGYLTEHEKMLKSKPVPAIAQKYYVEDNPFLFDLFCTVKDKDESGVFSARRPKLESLYDVFVNVRDDEREHWKTLCNLVQYDDMQGVENKLVEGTKPAPPEEVSALA